MTQSYKNIATWTIQEKADLLNRYRLPEVHLQDERFLRQLAVAGHVMREEYDVLKRLADS